MSDEARGHQEEPDAAGGGGPGGGSGGESPGSALPPDDEGAPPAPAKDFFVVGLGASAGGIELFSRILGAMPADVGMAFVVVLHLAREKTSSLVDILSRSTVLDVVAAEAGAELEPNTVYVLQPGMS